MQNAARARAMIPEESVFEIMALCSVEPLIEEAAEL
jgi:hypothetical protein